MPRPSVDGSIQVYRRHPGALLRASGVGVQTGPNRAGPRLGRFRPQDLFARPQHRLCRLVLRSRLAGETRPGKIIAPLRSGAGRHSRRHRELNPGHAFRSGRDRSGPPAATVAAGSSSAASAVASDRVLASEAARQWSRPTFAEMVDRVSTPRSLLVLALLLAGILLLVWLVVQQFRRNLSNVPLYNPAEPLTEPPFAGDEPTTGNERRISRDHLSSSPPKVSLKLVASEPSVPAAVLPSGAITARGSIPGVDEPITIPPNEKEADAIAPGAGLGSSDCGIPDRGESNSLRSSRSRPSSSTRPRRKSRCSCRRARARSIPRLSSRSRACNWLPATTSA